MDGKTVKKNKDLYHLRGERGKTKTVEISTASHFFIPVYLCGKNFAFQKVISRKNLQGFDWSKCSKVTVRLRMSQHFLP